MKNCRVSTGFVSAAVIIVGLTLSTAGVAGDSKMSAADEIKKIDTNNDGIVSAAEYAAGADMLSADAKMTFDTMDTDKDGNVPVTGADWDAARDPTVTRDPTITD